VAAFDAAISVLHDSPSCDKCIGQFMASSGIYINNPEAKPTISKGRGLAHSVLQQQR
jgi:hypothetical protein